jgi:hypothetical protein
MPIIFVCSVPFSGGERVAKSLAQKLGYAYLSREDVVARANEAGIPVGKLEVAMVKKPAVQERLARLKDRYLAVATAGVARPTRPARSESHVMRWRVSQNRPTFEVAPSTTTASEGPP